jgi:hypothetical protein
MLRSLLRDVTWSPNHHVLEHNAKARIASQVGQQRVDLDVAARFLSRPVRRPSLWARFKHQIKWSLSSAPKSAEAAAGHDYLT